MVDLHDLRGRAARSEQLQLSSQEALELLAEAETARKLLDLDENDAMLFPVQVSLITELMFCLSKGLATREQAELAATLMTQEIAGLVRMRVRTECRCAC